MYLQCYKIRTYTIFLHAERFPILFYRSVHLKNTRTGTDFTNAYSLVKSLLAQAMLLKLKLPDTIQLLTCFKVAWILTIVFCPPAKGKLEFHLMKPSSWMHPWCEYMFWSLKKQSANYKLANNFFNEKADRLFLILFPSFHCLRTLLFTSLHSFSSPRIHGLL